MKQKIRNIIQLGIKELRGLLRDPLMVVLIIYSFTLNVYVSAKSQPDSIHDAAIAIVDAVSSAAAMRRSSTPVRVRIHSSLVSTSFSRSALVRIFSGT